MVGVVARDGAIIEYVRELRKNFDLTVDPGDVECPSVEEDHSTLVLAAISPANGHRDTPGLIVSWMRKNGAPNISLTDVDRILVALARARKIKLKAKRHPSEDDRWELV